ncbi:hypothetical protein NMY22_g17670 [Coprinellus aureogranulatus]|nr:hypothetical protein NMY22_g17670 [Coprinellus aureogranulatus]
MKPTNRRSGNHEANESNESSNGTTTTTKPKNCGIEGTIAGKNTKRTKARKRQTNEIGERNPRALETDQSTEPTQ